LTKLYTGSGALLTKPGHSAQNPSMSVIAIFRQLSGDYLTHAPLRFSFQSSEMDAKGYRTRTKMPFSLSYRYGSKLCSTFSVQPPPVLGVNSNTIPEP